MSFIPTLDQQDSHKMIYLDFNQCYYHVFWTLFLVDEDDDYIFKI